MEFSIVFWNIWLTNQLDGAGSKRLFDGLDNLVESLNPDCFGLNEVLNISGGKATPKILQYLKGKGYKYYYYLASGPWTNQLDIGDAIASKYPIEVVKDIILGAHFNENGRDKTGKQAMAPHVRIMIGKNKEVDVIVAHLMHLRPSTLETHFKHQKNLAKYIRELPNSSSLIVGGDFNEFNLMPLSFSTRNKDILHHRTGSGLEPTWYNNAKKGSIVRANPDKIYWPEDSKLQIKEFTVISEYASDHRPLYARFAI